ncbi:hypothetical protein SAMN05443575_3475 [Jatrophihabitans endophyticus]|uniref:Copper(I)-binding protein n=1 Tax=Jatrophihabitans endophyticus TaxID=1206085 RepID=A0A1M5R8Q0_9ACTN|nr:hypothetical protein [Jatrophihabitans endophyticus]SHH22601.1 hypothetical protein SAMN05443575_3475 [Jatrophihabitans endophyticus]
MNADPAVRGRTGSARRIRIARVAGVAAIAAVLSSACAAGQQAQTADQHSSIDGTNQSLGPIDLRAVAVQSPPSEAPYYRAGTDAQLTVVLVNNGSTADRLVSVRSGVARGWAAFTDYNQAYQVQQAAGAQVTGSPVPAPSSSSSESSESSDSTGSAGSASSGSGSAPADPSDSVSGSTTGTGPRSGANTLPDDSGASSEGAGDSTSADASSASASSSAAPLPTGTRSVTLPPGVRVSFGTPEAKGAILLTGLTRAVQPAATVRVTFTFARAGSVTIAVPVQLAALPRQAGAGESSEESG